MTLRIARAVCLTAGIEWAAIFVATTDAAEKATAQATRATPEAGPSAEKGKTAVEPEQKTVPPVIASTARMEEALAQPTTVEYLDTQLRDVLTDLELRHKIDFELDTTALAAAGKGTDGKGAETLITKSMRGLPLEAALDHVLGEKQLEWYVQDGMVVVTTAEGAWSVTETKVYSVKGMNGFSTEPQYDEVVKVIEAAVFRAAGGQAHRTIRFHRPTKTIVVAASPIMQRDVRKLVGELHEAVQYQGDRRVLPLPTEAEAKIDAVLGGTGEFQYLDTRLEDVRTDLELRYQIFVEFDEEGIKNAGNDGARGPDALVTYQGRNVPFGAALDRMLEPLGLTWTRNELSLMITSKQYEPGYLTRRIYRVGDLARTAEERDELAQLIRETVAADTWRNELASEGPGTRPWPQGTGEMATFGPAQALVVTQTPRTHRAIERLLDDLRALRK